jgi:hypothetical protein
VPLGIGPLLLLVAGVLLVARGREQPVPQGQVNWKTWLGYQLIALLVGAAWVLGAYLATGVCLGSGSACEPGTGPVLWQGLVLFVPWAIIWLSPSVIAGARSVAAWRSGDANPATKRVGIFSGLAVLLVLVFIVASVALG